MALLEYYIQYDKKTDTAKVTHKVLEVEKGDRISYRSNSKESAIQYRVGSPFSGNGVPEADSPFPVGKGKGPFTVTEPIPKGKKLHFACGEIKVTKVPKSIKVPSGTIKKFKSWKGGGDGTPPGK